MSKLQQQILLGLTSSVPSSFVQGMNMAERRAARAAAEKARRDALAFQQQRFGAELPIKQSLMRTRESMALTAAERARQGQAKLDDVIPSHERALERIGASKTQDPQAFGEMTVKGPKDFAAITAGQSKRHFGRTAGDASIRANARTREKVHNKSLQDSGNIAVPGLDPNEASRRAREKVLYQLLVVGANAASRSDTSTFGDTEAIQRAQGYYNQAMQQLPQQQTSADPNAAKKAMLHELIGRGMDPIQALDQVERQFGK